jgi:DNA polymerase (family 10)
MNSIEEMAEYAGKKLGYGYIVITDHSKSTRIANGLDDTQILKQVDEIRKLNSLSGKPYILAGIEVDILPDGQLDIADEILARLDWVTASIHSKFETDNTERIIMACKNPYVNCIGHPYGRLIGSREAYPLDIDKVIKTAKATFTALEINAQPDRMDLTDNAARLAREAGVKLIISTDAHSTGNFEYMESGISIAQRAWCTANDILNTRPIDEVLQWRKKKLKNAGLPATQQ